VLERLPLVLHELSRRADAIAEAPRNR